jgi:hypothetical protein
MLALLIALLIVGWLAKDALKKYGLLTDARTAPADATAPASATDQVRALEKTMKQESEKRGGGY